MSFPTKRTTTKGWWIFKETKEVNDGWESLGKYGRLLHSLPVYFNGTIVDYNSTYANTKPCPVCGADLYVARDTDDAAKRVHLYCSRCGHYAIPE